MYLFAWCPKANIVSETKTIGIPVFVSNAHYIFTNIDGNFPNKSRNRSTHLRVISLQFINTRNNGSTFITRKRDARASCRYSSTDRRLDCNVTFRIHRHSNLSIKTKDTRCSTNIISGRICYIDFCKDVLNGSNDGFYNVFHPILFIPKRFFDPCFSRVTLVFHFSVIFCSTSPVFRKRLRLPMKDMERGAETSVPS